MNYQAAYLKMFTQLTNLINHLEALTPGEQASIPFLLREIQCQGEEACIAEKETIT